MSAYLYKQAVVSASPGAAADTPIVAAVAGKRIAVFGFWGVVGAAASHARFRSAANEIFTGGGAAIGMPLAANGVFSVDAAGEGDPNAYWFRTNVGEGLNFRVEVATEFTVGVVYREI